MLTSIINSLEQAKKLDFDVEKYTLLVNEKSETQGVLCFVPLGNREVKVLVPAPFHKDLVESTENFTYRRLLKHKEVIVLR